MPRLACWSCGRQIYTPSPVDSLFSEERRCPRCGAFLNTERRETDRRVHIRRQNPPTEPGPPADLRAAREEAVNALHWAKTEGCRSDPSPRDCIQRAQSEYREVMARLGGVR